MVATLSLTLALFVGPNKPAKAPAWADYRLAGYALAFDQTHSITGVSDPKTGFYIIRSVECDGGILTLSLTKDRHYISNMGFDVPSLGEASTGDESRTLKSKALPSLSTGKGIKIGDDVAAIVNKLGKPTKTEESGARDQFHSLIYKWHNTSKDNDFVLEETYTFKKGKLIEIIFNREENPYED